MKESHLITLLASAIFGLLTISACSESNEPDSQDQSEKLRIEIIGTWLSDKYAYEGQKCEYKLILLKYFAYSIFLRFNKVIVNNTNNII